MEDIQLKAAAKGDAPPPNPAMIVFVCANCARPGRPPLSSLRTRHAAPNFAWPVATRHIIVPCTGRLQPEHILKAFEDGANAVCVVACQEDNCHHVEGARRCARRVEFLRGMLNEVGLGAQRLMMFHLPGSARQDLAMGEAAGAVKAPSVPADALAAQIAAIRDEAMARLASLSENPMRRPEVSQVAQVAAGGTEQEEEESDE